MISRDSYPWSTLVVARKKTGVPYFSEKSNASWIISYASATEHGSKTGTLENMPKVRVSCSVCEEIGPGSSATSTTMPPFTPMYSRLISGSEATFRPTCFIVTSALAPL